MLKYQNIARTFPDGYHIKIYELRGCQKTWPANAHAHEYFQMWYVSQGVCLHEIEGESCEVIAGDLILVPPDVEHSIIPKDVECMIFGCDFAPNILLGDPLLSQMEKLGQEAFYSVLCEVRCKYVIPEDLQQRMENTMQKMLNIYTKKQPYSIIELKGYLLRILTNIVQVTRLGYDSTKKFDGYGTNINAAISYAREHLTERIYIKDVAACAKMSVGSFHYYFKKYTGKSYLDYLNMLRIDLAKMLLVESDLSISAIGYQAGYSDAAYFNRQFKKLVGCTPGKYRGSNRNI
ncbi:MAG: helix-turn-helix transcriptional regulator [Oscillospiraceae bacterium]|nr:helix-turn-helix transcriptional regulator [Oscillospiraceae bacterium]